MYCYTHKRKGAQSNLHIDYHNFINKVIVYYILDGRYKLAYKYILSDDRTENIYIKLIVVLHYVHIFMFSTRAFDLKFFELNGVKKKIICSISM